MIGQGVALLSFTGRKTGKHYTIPVSYHRESDIVTVITKRQRRWWHNFETPLEVELRLAGHTFAGKAEARSSDEETLEFMTGYLEKRPIDAKAYGLKKDEITREKLARILPHIVVIRIEIAPIESGAGYLTALVGSLSGPVLVPWAVPAPPHDEVADSVPARS